jgi:hypothetical protein
VPRFLLIAFAAVAAACDLTPAEIPLGDPVVVVHGVMRADRGHQFIVVERSFTGEIEDVFLGGTIPTKGAPADPIRGATVMVRNIDLPDDPCGSPVQFLEEINGPGTPERYGVYWAPEGCPTLRPGDSLELLVETPAGDSIGGAALVTGLDSAILNVLGEDVPFGADTVITFNRDRDILRLSVEPIAGRLLQVEVLRTGQLDMFRGIDVWPGARIHADTMSVAIPGDLVDAGGRSDGGDVFRAGRDYILTVAVTDLNYYDFSRSSSNDYTGRGFLNRLTGGIGVFGSLSASSLPLRVVGELDDEREGDYWLRGTVRDIPVDAILTVYAVRSAKDTEASALLTGNWFSKEVVPGTEGEIQWQPYYQERLLFEGNIEDDFFNLVAMQPGADRMRRIKIAGDRKADAAFTFAVVDSMQLANDPLGTVTATQR